MHIGIEQLLLALKDGVAVEAKKPADVAGAPVR